MLSGTGKKLRDRKSDYVQDDIATLGINCWQHYQLQITEVSKRTFHLENSKIKFKCHPSCKAWLLLKCGCMKWFNPNTNIKLIKANSLKMSLNKIKDNNTLYYNIMNLLRGLVLQKALSPKKNFWKVWIWIRIL